ncbi:helix-turn-helix domain-containing protein [Halocynthiibacter sp.]|uniref:helix-turn-helix domain-containing protein n=1 Tax=Halocynthiibacter sp. TaxID=1979210 RepID=UPI003C3A07F8
MNTDSEILNLLPARLKEARRKQGLSLDAVARLSGVSRSMVSQIERGESSPTIATLWNLISALQIDFAGLLEDGATAPKIEVLRAGQTPSIENRGEGCNIRILSPPEDAGRQELYDLEFRDGGRLDSAPHSRGTREHLTVISGQLQVTSGALTEEISAGDTARYPADVHHCITALNGPARALLVVQNA